MTADRAHEMNWLDGQYISEVELTEVEQIPCLALRTPAGAWLSVPAPWQIRSTQRVVLSSGDQGQVYGFREPIDVLLVARALLVSRQIEAVRIAPISGEIELAVSGAPQEYAVGATRVRVTERLTILESLRYHDMLMGPQTLVSFKDTTGYEGWSAGQKGNGQWIQGVGGSIHSTA